MRTLLSVAVVISAAFLFVDCSASRALSKRAYELEQAGLTREAADFYYMSLQRDPRNVDAKIGLNKTGKEVLDETLNDFFKAQSAGDHKQAVYAYLDAAKYRDKCNVFVNLTIPSYYEELYLESLEVYLARRYKDSEELMYHEKYEEADAVLREIVKLRPDYKDAEELLQISKVEPMYQKGVRAYDERNYRESYLLMKRIVEKKGTYKDAIDYRNKALERATQTIAFTDIKTRNPDEESLAASIKAKMLSGLVNNDNPFIKIIDRSNTERILEEQRLNMTMSSGRETRVQAGELLGADVLITGEIIYYKAEGGDVKRYKKPAFEQIQVRKVNPRTGEKYMGTSTRETAYDEYYGEKEVNCKFQFQLINSQTGEIIASDIIDQVVKDLVSYANYRGDHRNLMPASYAEDGSLTSAFQNMFSRSARMEFNRKFTTQKRKFKSDETLRGELGEKIAKQLIARIESINSQEL